MPLDPKNKVILLADDDNDDQDLLEEALLEVNSGIKADMVSNGKEVLEYLEQCGDNLPCAIVLDYNMPVMTGAQALAIICKDPRYEDIPKFVWSTSSANAHIKECIDHGALSYFIKPDNQNKLKNIAERILDACHLE